MWATERNSVRNRPTFQVARAADVQICCYPLAWSVTAHAQEDVAVSGEGLWAVERIKKRGARSSQRGSKSYFDKRFRESLVLPSVFCRLHLVGTHWAVLDGQFNEVWHSSPLCATMRPEACHVQRAT
jgi:hypothetical protein